MSSGRNHAVELAAVFACALVGILGVAKEARSACWPCTCGCCIFDEGPAVIVDPGAVNKCNSCATVTFRCGCCGVLNHWGPFEIEGAAGSGDPAALALTSDTGQPDGGPGAAVRITTDGASWNVCLEKPEEVTGSFKLKFTAYVDKVPYPMAPPPESNLPECTSCDGKPDSYVGWLEVQGSGSSNCDGTGTGGCGSPGSACGDDKQLGSGTVSVQYPRASIKLSLGLSASGRTAGALFMDIGDPPPSVITGAGLQLMAAPGVVDLGDTDAGPGYCREIQVPQGSVRVVDTVPGAGYFEVGFYTPQDVNNPVRVWAIQDFGVGQSPRLRVTDSANSTYSELTPAAAGHGWTLQQWQSNGQDVTEVRTVQQTDDAGTEPTATCQTSHPPEGGGDPVVDSRVDTEYRYVDGRLRVYQKRVHTDAPIGTLTTTFSYPDAQTTTVTYPDGSWLTSEYDTGGRKIRETRPIALAGGTYGNHVVEYGYDDLHQIDAGYCRPGNPRIVTESVDGTVVGRTFHAYYYVSSLEWAEEEQRDTDPASGSGFGDADNLTTITQYYTLDINNPLAVRGRPSQIAYPDGQAMWTVYYMYDLGAFTPGSASAPGTFDRNTPGPYLRTRIIGNVRTTRETITDPAGKILQTAEYVGSVSDGGTPFDWTVYSYLEEISPGLYGDRGRLQHEYHLNGTARDLAWSECCGLDSERDAAGIYTTYDTRDALGRVTRKTKHGVNENDSVEQWDYEYDTLGHKRHETVTDVSGAGGGSLTTSHTYWQDGRIQSTTDPGGVVTWYVYEDSCTGDNGRKVTAIRPYGAADAPREVTQYYRDGRLRSVETTDSNGEQVLGGRYYDYGANADGSQWTLEYGPDVIVNGHSGHTSTKTTTDPAGRTKQIEKPAFGGGDPLVTKYGYYGPDDVQSGLYSGQYLGRLKSVRAWVGEAPVGAATLYEYDDYAEVSRTGFDVVDDGVLNQWPDYDQQGNPLPADRITRTAITFDEPLDQDRWKVVTHYAYLDDGTEIVTGAEKQWLSTSTGLGPTGFTARSKSLDAAGRETTTTTQVTRESKQVDTTVQYPDGTSTVSMQVNGLLTERTSRSALTTSYVYDGLGRQTDVTDPRTGTSHTTYEASTGRVHSTADPAGNTTVYEYYPTEGAEFAAGAGRVKSIEAPNGKKQYFAYTPTGQQWRTWGDTPYPVEYVYDAYGRKTEMHTYRGGTGWNGTSWPASPGTADVTTWLYDPATGLLARRQYADANGTDYTYTADGKMATRAWARGVSATYAYDDATRELLSVNYSDSTPPVTFTYDRLGRRHTIEDAVGTRTFAYRDGSDLQLETETIAAGANGLYSKTITRLYDDYGRNAGLSINSDYTVGYAYEASTGQLNKITGPGLPVTDGVSYERLADSDLIWKTNFGTGATPPAQIVRSYEDHRDLLLMVENRCSGNLISSYDYDVDGQDHAADSVGRRTKVAYAGSAFNRGSPAPPVWAEWQYNDRNEVNYSRTYGSGDVTLWPYERGYSYDPIGNRTSRTGATAGDTRYYCSNALNQYVTQDDMQGCPPPPPVQETFGYDLDGNMAQDWAYNYAWDAENRLISVTPRTPVVGSSKKCVFAYDYLNRRVQKEVYGYYSDGHGGYQWLLDARERYVYDGWNVVLTLNALSSNAITRKCTWGLDLSGSLQGAGGIGGLLATVEGTYAHWFFFDGNGNVTEMIQPPVGGLQAALPADEPFTVLCDPAGGDSTDPDSLGDLGVGPLAGGGGGSCGGGTACAVLAHYEYDPFGQTVYSSGTCASINPFRFSTKWYDAETGLWYFGYRYLWRGKWLSRDPIGEHGGANVYSFVSNRPPQRVDVLGLSVGGMAARCLEGICPDLGVPCEDLCKNAGAVYAKDYETRGFNLCVCGQPKCACLLYDRIVDDARGSVLGAAFLTGCTMAHEECHLRGPVPRECTFSPYPLPDDVAIATRAHDEDAAWDECTCYKVEQDCLWLSYDNCGDDLMCKKVVYDAIKNTSHQCGRLVLNDRLLYMFNPPTGWPEDYPERWEPAWPLTFGGIWWDPFDPWPGSGWPFFWPL